MHANSSNCLRMASPRRYGTDYKTTCQHTNTRCSTITTTRHSTPTETHYHMEASAEANHKTRKPTANGTASTIGAQHTEPHQYALRMQPIQQTAASKNIYKVSHYQVLSHTHTL